MICAFLWMAKQQKLFDAETAVLLEKDSFSAYVT